MVARLAEMSRGNLEENRSRMAKASGFSLHAGVAAKADKRNIAPSKAWEGGNPCERMKPFERIQLVKVQSG